MFKRIMLAFTFVAALGVVGLGFSSNADAWSDCNNGYAYSPYAYPTYAAYGPRVVYYPTYPVRNYPVFYGHVDGHHHHHDHHHNGLVIGFHF